LALTLAPAPDRSQPTRSNLPPPTPPPPPPQPPYRQPFIHNHPDGRVISITNGEIYNHAELREEISAASCGGLNPVHAKGAQIDPSVDLSDCDCAVVGPLYIEAGRDVSGLPARMDGMYASAMYDEANGRFVAFRDEMGKACLYWGRGPHGELWLASEMKAIQDVCDDFDLFPPGHYLVVDPDGSHTFTRWFTEPWAVDPEGFLPRGEPDLTKIHDLLVRGVVKRLMVDVPFGILLSGGLDSSLVASIAVKHLLEAKNCPITDPRQIPTFSIGLEGSPDLVAAQKVADHLGTNHTNFTFTVEEGIDALRDLVWHIESYEQVRAAIPMYLLCRKIKATGVKMVLSGEGADELYGGYLYFHEAPDGDEFHRECARKTTRLHQWDVLRANKAPFAWGVEPRVPFLDRDFMNYSMTIDGKHKQPRRDPTTGKAALDADGRPVMEKYLIRKAFDSPTDPYLPDSVLWRQKEQFSDGVGYDWVDGLKDFAASIVSDAEWDARAERFPVDTPRSREYYLLRTLFAEQFPKPAALETVPRGLSVACSTPEAVNWKPEWKELHEISGRAIANVHEQAEGFGAMDAGARAGARGKAAASAEGGGLGGSGGGAGTSRRAGAGATMGGAGAAARAGVAAMGAGVVARPVVRWSRPPAPRPAAARAWPAPARARPAEGWGAMGSTMSRSMMLH